MRYVLLALLCAASAHAEPYVALRAGGHVWADRSNHDEVETGAYPGVDAAVAVGWSLAPCKSSILVNLRTCAGWNLDLEASLSAHLDALHGRNHHHATDERSADGHWLAQTALSVGAWPRVRIAGPLWLTGGGSVGYALVRAFDDVELAPTWAAGAGVLLDITPNQKRVSRPLVVEMRWEHRETGDTEHDGYALDWESNAIMLGLRW